MRLDSTQSHTQTPFNQSGYETRLNSLIPRPPSTSLGMRLDFNTVCTMCGVPSLLLCILLHIHGNGFNFGKTMQSPHLRWFLFLVHDVLPHVYGYYALRKYFSRYVFVSLRKFSKKKYKTSKNQNKQQNKLIYSLVTTAHEDKITSFTGTIINCFRDTTQQLGVKLISVC